MTRGSRLAVWAGLVAICAALATLLLAVVLPGSEAGADKGGGGHCAAADDDQGASGKHGHPHSHSDHGACAAAQYRGSFSIPSFSVPALTRPSPATPPKHVAAPTTAQPTAATVESVPQTRTNLSIGPSQEPPPAPTSPARKVTVTATATATATASQPAAIVAAPVAEYPSRSSVTLPGTLAAFALAVAGVVAVAGYRRRGTLLATTRRPGPGAGPRHGRPRGRHSRR